MTLGEKEPVLGVDFGPRKVGYAVSPDGKNAFPVKTIRVKSRREAVAKTVEEARRRGALRVVVGVARTPGGEVGRAAANALAFVEALRAEGLAAETFDEAFSSRAAAADLSSVPVSAKARRKAEDAVAAAGILSGWIAARRLRGDVR